MKEVIISPKAIEELDESITQVQDGLAIICNGNTHAAIENEHFAYVKNHPDLPDGLYQAKAAIAANEALSTSNLTADPSGGLNKLKEDVDALNSKITTNTYSIGDAFTAATNVTIYNGDYSYAEKSNKTVLMHIYVETSLAGTAKIGTIKSDFVPAKKIFCYCYNWTTKNTYRAEIDTSGNVYVYDMVSGSNSYMLIAMYFVN